MQTAKKSKNFSKFDVENQHPEYIYIVGGVNVHRERDLPTGGPNSTKICPEKKDLLGSEVPVQGSQTNCCIKSSEP